MNKKISTLMAGVALMGAMSVGAQDKVTTLPSVTTRTGGLQQGDYVYLNYSTARYPLDFTGAWTANSHKDSLIWNDAAVTGRSKAHIDSLLFQVNWKEVPQLYNGVATKERVYTFTNKFGKFAVAKPAEGKTIPAYLEANGELSEWILPVSYTAGNAVTSSRYGCAPYVVATRTSSSDATPLTVYVLAKKLEGVSITGPMEVLEVKYDNALTDIISATNKYYVTYDKDEGIGTLSGVSGATHLLYRIDGVGQWVDVANLDVDVTSGNIQDALGTETETPSFAFAKGVSEGEDNFLAAYNWEYTSAGYLKAIGAEQIGTGRDLYLTVDTFYYDEANKQNFKLALDTLPGASGTTVNTDMIRNADTYKFTINATFGKDSISIVPQNFPTLTGNYFKGNNRIAVTPNTDALPIIIKTFGDKTVLTVKHSNDTGIAAPAITASETPTWTLSDDEIAQYTAGDVYSLFDANKMKGDKKTANPNYGKALIIDNMSNRTAQVFVDTEDFDATLPSHQWMVLKKNKG